MSAIVPRGHAATGNVMPSPRFYCLDDNGTIIPSGRLFTYDAGTSTKRDTFTTAALTVANSNPIVCDAAGRLTAFLTPGVAYKFVLAAAGSDDPPSSPLWTVDNISSVPVGTVDLDITGTAGEALTAGDALYLSDGSGSCGATAGRWYKADADAACSSTNAQAIGFAVANISSAASGSVRIQGKVTGLAGLAAGTVYYVSATAGAITSSAPTLARAVGVADSGTTLVISSGLTPTVASASVPGIVSITTQSFAGDKTFTGAVTVSGATTLTLVPTFYPGTTTTTRIRPEAYLGSEIATTGNVGTGEDKLKTTLVIKGGTLDTDGSCIYVKSWGTTSADADSKVVRLRLGTSGTAASNTLVAQSPDMNTGVATPWEVTAEICRESAAVQRFHSWEASNGISAFVNNRTGALTLSGDLNLDVTGESVDNNDITCLGWIIRWGGKP